MKSAAAIIAISIGCTLGTLSPVLAQQVRSADQITKDLCPGGCTPVPAFLRSGEQGLPTPGAAPAPPPRPIVRASTSNAAPRPAQPQAHPADTAAMAKPEGCPAAQDGGLSSSLPSITFEFNSAQLRPSAIPQLEELAKALKNVPESNSLMIEGHTDGTGTFVYNQDLSTQRAQAVKDYLTSQEGVKQQLVIRGVGFCDPANPKDPRAAENRRVVVINNPNPS